MAITAHAAVARHPCAPGKCRARVLKLENIMARKQTRSFFNVALACVVAALALGCEAMEADDGGNTSTVDSEIRAQIEDLAVRAQVLEDREAIRSAADCYGRGHDEIFRHLQGDQRASLAILRKCHVDDVATDIFFFTEDAPMAQLTSLEQLVGFIEQFAVNSKYTSARNVPGDIAIELTGPDTAVMTSATSAPHFIQSPGPGVQPTLDVVSAHYRDELARGTDGVWRTTRKALTIDQFWRGTGSYPFAM